MFIHIIHVINYIQNVERQCERMTIKKMRWIWLLFECVCLLFITTFPIEGKNVRFSFVDCAICDNGRKKRHFSVKFEWKKNFFLN